MESGEDSEGSDSEKVVNVAVRVPSDAAHVYLQINLHALCTSISKFGKKLRHLPIPQLIALITITCNQDRSIVLYRNHL